ncbi:MAG: 50S ribosomal protein L21, partial [Ruminococcaceae bacterium]|nr:50S ribosomal protein L21 [Oscillospiraceae bacterium]
MKAVFVTGGKQYTANVGDVLFIEKLNVEAEETVVFDQVLLVGEGAEAKFGTPVVEGAKVEAKVIKNGKGK